MALVVAGLGCSHAPSIANAYDNGLTEEPGWRPLFRGFECAREWLMAQRPDALVVVYNDHLDSYFLDAWSTFAIGVAESYLVSDEGWGPRQFPPVPGHKGLARHVATRMVADGIDLTVSHRMELDHGFVTPMPLLDEGWKLPVVPIAINVVLEPMPPPARCWAFGEALGRAVASYAEDLRIAIIGTGGLSHQLSGTDFGKVFPVWDLKFMEMLEKSPRDLCSYSMADFARLGGTHSVEVVQWLAMRAALPASAATELRFYYPYGLMGYGIVGFKA